MSVLIIAEAGVNHNGSLVKAKEMVDVAVAAGADCIKFQTFVSEELVSKYADKAAYQKTQKDEKQNQLDMLKKLELSNKEFEELKIYCGFKSIEFLSTAFDLKSIDFLSSMDMSYWKIPSGEMTNLPYLIKIATLGKPIIMSSGMCTLLELKDAYEVLKKNGSGEITILHCTTEYPTSLSHVNLMAMRTIATELDVAVGYSDHTLGIEVPIAAVALGACVIEKHFTLSRELIGPDHQASLEPDELAAMVRGIRNVEIALGDGVKRPFEVEMDNSKVARKSIVAKLNIKKGDLFTDENITIKRPGTGISPMRWYDIIGLKATRDFNEDELIEL